MQEIINPFTPVLIKDLGMLFTSNKQKYKARFGIYQCYCGNTFKAQCQNIKNNHTKSCGCNRSLTRINLNITHGLNNHKLYNTWKNMIARCTNSNDPRFFKYGGRGITVCERWMDINNFIEDMYPTFEDGLSIDRINNDGNYEPSNCRWTTSIVQARNTRVLRSDNTSGYRGVYFSKESSKWVTLISINNKRIYLGRFIDALDGAKAYDSYVIENNLEHTINGVL